MQPQDWDPHGLQVSDDWIIMPLQSGTQWDGLSHIGYDGKLYNGYSADDVSTRFGARRLAVDAMTDRIVGRGVLLDIARLHGSRLARGRNSHHPGRSGSRRDAPKVSWWGRPTSFWSGPAGALGLLAEGRDGWMSGEPGLDIDCARLASPARGGRGRFGQLGVSRSCPARSTAPSCRCTVCSIRDMGMPLAEILDLEALAEDCVADGRWSFLFVAPPLHISNAVGSPTTPIAIK